MTHGQICFSGQHTQSVPSKWYLDGPLEGATCPVLRAYVVVLPPGGAGGLAVCPGLGVASSVSPATVGRVGVYRHECVGAAGR